MSRPWMPLYIADYLQDTGHLSTAEHGAYFLLMMHYWANKGLPVDDKRLARIVRMSDREWSGAKDTIAGFFSDGWKHKRIEFEMTEAERISNAGRAGGKASAQARAQRNGNDTPTIVERPLNEIANEPPTKPPALQLQRDKEERKTSIRRVAVATVDAFEEFWKVYPKRDGENPKKPALKKFLALTLSGADPPVIIASAKRYAEACSKRKEVGTRFVAQAVTWLSQERFSDYGERPAENPKLVKPVHGQVLGDEYSDKAGRTFVLAETPEWDAWCRHGREQGRVAPPRYFHEGWAFPSRWPPGHEVQQEAAE